MCQSLFFNKLAGLTPPNLLKKTPTVVFFCGICEIFKNAFFTEQLWTTT